MNTEMSKITRQEVLAKKRDRYARAGKEHKSKIIDELVELFGYHRASDGGIESVEMTENEMTEDVSQS